jgi:DNA-binding response OmpR family regulator
MKNILLLEDDIKISREIESQLYEENYLITAVKTIQQTQALDFAKFDLLIFDWNLPDGESIDLVEKIRAQEITTPILILTANTQTSYRDQAREKGANDFLGKPFYFHELKARIEVLLKSPHQKVATANTIESSGIAISRKEIMATFQGVALTLTRKEFDLLLFFLSNPNVVFSRNEILDAVWGGDENPSPRTVDTHILNIRKKTNNELFQTVWSSGYRFVPISES